MKIEIISNVENGNLKRNRSLIKKALESLEGKTIKLTIEKNTKKRSNNQNNFYWGVLIPIAKQGIFECWGEVWGGEQVHNMLLDVCPIYRDVVNEKTGEVISIKKRSSEMTTTDMMTYWEQCRKYLSLNFYIQVPEPNEDLTLNFNE